MITRGAVCLNRARTVLRRGALGDGRYLLQKADALLLADKIGAKKASEQLSISYPTILDWRKKREGVPTPAIVEKLTLPPTSTMEVPCVENQSLEMRIQLLQQENAQLKTQLTRQAQAIHALSPLEG